MIQDRTLKNFQIKSLFEYFNSLVSKPGERPAFSSFIFNNFTLLQGPYYNIINKINARDPNVVAYEKEYRDICTQFADRDDQGNIKLDQKGNPIILEQQIEFSKACETLNAKFEKIGEKIQAEHQREQEAMNDETTVKLDCITITEFIDSCPPFVVGLTHI